MPKSELPPSGYPETNDFVLYRFTPSRTKSADRSFKHSGFDWTLEDAYCGTQIFGMIGSGKTSGSGYHLSNAFLKSGFGGLVLCHKIEEIETWRQRITAAGRKADIIEFSAENGSKFNFLDYESTASGGSTENLYRLFSVLAEIGERTVGASSSDPFWKNAMKELVVNAIDLLKMAGEPITLPLIEKVITSSASSPEMLNDSCWRDTSFCFKLIGVSHSKKKSAQEASDFQQTASYWLKNLPNLSDKTRSCIFAVFSGVALSFMRGDMRQMFCEGTSNVVPEMTLEGKIIILALPVKTHYEAGRYAQVLFKYMWQRVMERRQTLPLHSNNLRPQFLWVDEAHNFFVSHDTEFGTTSRSAKVASVYLTQNMENYKMVVPAGDNGIIGSFLGNLKTKIFHANEDAATNEYASKQIGMRKFSETRTTQQFDKKSSGNGSKPVSETKSKETWVDVQVATKEFSNLRRGGINSKFIIEAFVTGQTRPRTIGGRIFAAIKCAVGRDDPDENFIKAKFKQPGNSP